MIIAIDVDETVVDSRIPIHTEEEAIAYFNQTDLYDNFEPIKNAVEAVKSIKDAGNTVVFITRCFENHKKSKLNFLLRYFEFDGFLDASKFTHKYIFNYDFLIDDNQRELEHVPPEKRILFKNWDDTLKILKEKGVNIKC